MADHLPMQVPQDLQRILFGNSAFQFLSAGIDLGLFSLLNSNPSGLAESEISEKLGLQRRCARGLLLGCSSLALLMQDRNSGEVLYRNSDDIKNLFSGGWWKHFADIVHFEAKVVGPGQTKLTQSLLTNTNAGLAELPGSSEDLYRRFGENSDLKTVFFNYMRSWSEIAGPGLVSTFPGNRVSRLLDLGGGDATNAIRLAKSFPELSITMTDISPACDLAREAIAAAKLMHRINVLELDMFRDEFPPLHDCIAFIHQMVIWDEGQCESLLRKAYNALPINGKVVIYNSVSHNDGSGPFVAAMDNGYFLTVPSKGGFIYSEADYRGFLNSAGFSEVKIEHVQSWTPHALISGIRDA